jgi:hypothetical protein
MISEVRVGTVLVMALVEAQGSWSAIDEIDVDHVQRKITVIVSGLTKEQRERLALGVEQRVDYQAIVSANQERA